MENLASDLTFIVPLSASEHRLAQLFSKQQSNSQKAKQVYLNTLAVSAVQFYLHCMGIQTNWAASLSWNPVMQNLMDVADLEIPNLGKLECRPVLPEKQFVYIPAEVWSERIGYVAVQLDSSLKQATLLGFVNKVACEELPLSELRSLADLLEHLNPTHERQLVQQRVNLSQWFERIFEAGWCSLEELLGTNPKHLAFTLRSKDKLSQASVQRAKLINLGLQLASQSVAMLIAITPEAEQKVGILVQVHPMNGETYLPSNLKLSLLSDAGEILQEVQSRSQDNYIQLKGFRGLPGEGFDIQVAFGDASVKETFVI